jgi:hypothetical protein
VDAEELALLRRIDVSPEVERALDALPEVFRTAVWLVDVEERSRDAAAIEAWFRQSRLGFETRVLDLGMMGFEPVGGRVPDLAGRTSALYTYRGPAGEALVCQMYEGRTDALPPGATELVPQRDHLPRLRARRPHARVLAGGRSRRHPDRRGIDPDGHRPGCRQGDEGVTVRR